MTVEIDIFNEIFNTFTANLAWAKEIRVEKPITEIDAVDISNMPLVQAFWNPVTSIQQPQRGKTYTTAPLVIQIIDQTSYNHEATQQALFQYRIDVKDTMMKETLPAVKSINKDFVDFGYKGRVYDIHSFGDGTYLAELFFDAKFNENYGYC